MKLGGGGGGGGGGIQTGIWHNDDGNSKADQCHGQLRCTSLIATLRPTNGSFASLFPYICYAHQSSKVTKDDVITLQLHHFRNVSWLF